VPDEVRDRQNRPLETSYAIVYPGTHRVSKAGQTEKAVIKTFMRLRGSILKVNKEVLGLWIAETEGAEFRTGVLTEPKNRGVHDIPIAWHGRV
jgi:transposase-like protein